MICTFISIIYRPVSSLSPHCYYHFFKNIQSLSLVELKLFCHDDVVACSMPVSVIERAEEYLVMSREEINLFHIKTNCLNMISCQLPTITGIMREEINFFLIRDQHRRNMCLNMNSCLFYLLSTITLSLLGRYSRKGWEGK